MTSQNPEEARTAYAEASTYLEVLKKEEELLRELLKARDALTAMTQNPDPAALDAICASCQAHGLDLQMPDPVDARAVADLLARLQQHLRKLSVKVREQMSQMNTRLTRMKDLTRAVSI